MDKKIDRQTFDEPGFKRKIVSFLKSHGKAATLAEITVGTGLHQDWIEFVLRKLFQIYHFDILIDENTRQIQYLFDFSKRRTKPWKMLEVLWRGLEEILSIIWMLMAFLFLVAYTFIGGLVFGLIITANYPLMLVTIPILSFFIDIDGFRKRAMYYQDDFIESVLGFQILQLDVFSFKSVREFFLGKRYDTLAIEKKLLEYIRLKGGKICIAEIIQLTGWSIEAAKDQSIKLLGQYNGRIEVTEHGYLQYFFEDLEEPALDTSFFPRIWAEKLPIKQLCNLPMPDFIDMLWRTGAFILYSAGQVFCILLLVILNMRHIKPELFSMIMFFGLPIYLLAIAYLMMAVRYAWYSYLNKAIHKENEKRRVIENLCKQGPEMPFGQTSEKICMQLGAETRIKEDGSLVYYFEEFDNPDLPIIPLYKTLVIDEQFEDNSNRWAEGDDHSYYLKVKDGKYYFKHKRSEGSWTTQLKRKIETEKTYFKIETALSFIEGKESSGFGLVFGRDGFDKGYQFLLASSGYFCIFYDNEELKTISLVDWTKSPYVNKHNAVNILTIQKSGDDWVFYINQQEVHRMAALGFYGPGIGFTLSNKMSIAIDYLYIEMEM